MGRIGHSGTVAVVKRDSLELSLRSAVARKEPREESVARTSRDSCQSRTVALNTEPRSSRAAEAREAAAWEAAGALCAGQLPRRRRPSAVSTCGVQEEPPPPVQLATQGSEEPRRHAHLRECKLRGLGESDNQTQASAASVFLGD